MSLNTSLRFTLASALTTQGEFARAQDLFQTIQDESGARSANSEFNSGSIETGLAHLALARKDHDLAEALIGESLDKRLRLNGGRETINVLLNRLTLSEVSQLRGQHEEARKRAHEIHQKLIALVGSDHPLIVSTTMQRLSIEIEARNAEAAQDLLLEASTQFGAGRSESDWRRHALDALEGATLLLASNYQTGRSVLQQAIRQLDREVGENASVTQEARRWLEELDPDR